MSQEQDPPAATNWRGMFTSRHGGTRPAPTVPPAVPAPTLVVDRHVDAPVSGDDPRQYRAFIVDRDNKRQAYLEIRYFSPTVPGIEEGYVLSMPQFMQAQFIGDMHIVLHFSHTVFRIEGRGIGQLVDALKRGTLHTIQQFNANRWGEPPPDQPKVTLIEAITPERIQELARQLQGRGRDKER